MQHGVGVDVRREVVGRLVDEEPVRDEQARGAETAHRLEHVRRCRDHEERERGQDQRGERRGKDAPNAAGVEAAPVQPSRGCEIAQQDARDEKAGQDEEDVDADEAAAQTTEPGVERDDEIDRDRPQPIEVRAIAQVRFTRAGSRLSLRRRHHVRPSVCAPDRQGVAHIVRSRRDCRDRAGSRAYDRCMTLRMHPVSASRWAQLAATRHPIDLTDEESTPEPPPDKARRRSGSRDEHAKIQAQVDAIAAPRVSSDR